MAISIQYSEVCSFCAKERTLFISTLLLGYNKPSLISKFRQFGSNIESISADNILHLFIQILFVVVLIPLLHFISFNSYKLLPRVVLFHTCFSKIGKVLQGRNENQHLHIQRDESIDEDLLDMTVNPDMYINLFFISINLINLFAQCTATSINS